VKIDYNDPLFMEACTTDRQREILQAHLDNGQSAAKTGELLGISERNIHMTLARIRKSAGSLSGTSTLEDDVGDKKLRWVKRSFSAEQRLKLMQIAIDAMMEELPKIKPTTSPQIKGANTDIVPWFNIGDAHIGMLAYSKETGHNFDLKIAEAELCKALHALMDRVAVGKYERCVIQDMGDFTHYENVVGKTAMSGHDLDIDTRYRKMVHIYTRIMRSIVEYALSKFKYVDVIINQGNHSRANDFWMVELLQNLYEKEPRLTVLDNTCVYTAYRMGNTFVMSHHSDKCQPKRLVEVMATKFRQDFGEAQYKYVDIGHLHHAFAHKELGGVIVECFNNLAPSDAWAHDAGFLSSSFLTCVLRSKTYGEKGRERITVEEVKDMLANAVSGTHVNIRPKVYTLD